MSSELAVSAQNIPEYEPDVAYNSTRDEYFAVWYDDDGTALSVMGARYSAAGVRIGEYVIAYEGSPVRDNALPSVAYDSLNEQYLVVWVRDYWGDGTDHDIYGRYVPWDGPDGGHLAFSINDATGNQAHPRVAYGGTAQEFMVTWWNAGAVPWVSAQRFAAGGPAQGGVITVTSDATQPRMYPDIAYNQARNEYIIAYQRENMGNTDIYGVRLSASGAVLGGGDFGIAGWPEAESMPRITASRVSNVWAVAWQSDSPTLNLDVYSRLIWVDGTGAVQMAAPVQVASTSVNESYPDIAAHPESSNFLITWEQQYSSTTGPYGISARVLNADVGLRNIFVPTAPSVLEENDRRVPAVAGGVNDWMVVWEHERFATPSYQDIHGRILFANIMKDGFESGDMTGWSSTVP